MKGDRKLANRIFKQMKVAAEPTAWQVNLQLFLKLIAVHSGRGRGLIDPATSEDPEYLYSILADLTAFPDSFPLPRSLSQPIMDAMRKLSVINWAKAAPTLAGDLYAHLMDGRRRKGSYYTPQLLAEDIAGKTISLALASRSATAIRILDPAAGSGHFLLAAGKVLADHFVPEGGITAMAARRQAARSLYGVDLDPLALELSATALWLWLGDPAVRPRDFSKRLRCGDTLLDDDLFGVDGFPPDYDILIGNPPFVSAITQSRQVGGKIYRAALKSRYQTAEGSFDLSVPFIERSVELCRSGGICGFVLPNMLLSANYASTLRRWLLERVSLHQIGGEMGSPIFDAGVYPISLLFENRPPIPDQPFTVRLSPRGSALSETIASHADLSENPGDVWAGILDPAWRTLHPIFGRTIPFDEVAVISAGLTVDEAYKLRAYIRDIPSGQPAPPDAARLITSRLIQSYYVQQREVVYLKARYQNPVIALANLPPRRRAQTGKEKIIVAGMGKELRAAYDPGGLQASVATLIITNSEYPLLSLCAILNSRLISRIYRALFGGLALSGGYLRFTRRELALLPFPKTACDDPIIAELGELAAQVAAKPSKSETIREQIDRIVCDLYNVPFDIL